jgi:hypothetical protein
MDPAAWADLLKAMATSWAFWVTTWAAIVGIVALLLFRSPVQRLIANIKRLRWGGRAIEVAQQAAQAQPALAVRTAGDAALANLDNQYVRQQEAMVRQWLETNRLAGDPPEAVRVLTRYVAIALMYADFEEIEAMIFGSQVRIVEAVNMQPRPAEQIRSIYEAAAATERAVAEYPFERYRDFLIRMGLMTESPTIAGHYEVTTKGRAFLMWRVERGKIPATEKVG